MTKLILFFGLTIYYTFKIFKLIIYQDFQWICVMPETILIISRNECCWLLLARRREALCAFRICEHWEVILAEILYQHVVKYINIWQHSQKMGCKWSKDARHVPQYPPNGKTFFISPFQNGVTLLRKLQTTLV